MSTVSTLGIEARRCVDEMRSYAIDFAASAANDAFMVMGLLLGIVANIHDSPRVHSIILGLVIWRITAASITSMALLLQDELQLGTFEQLLMSRVSVTRVLLGRLLVNVVMETLLFYAVALSVVPLLGGDLLAALITPRELFLILLASVGFIGLGLLFCGLTLRFKRASAIARLATNLVLFFSGMLFPLSVLGTTADALGGALPFSWLMKTVASPFPAWQPLGLLLLTSVVWLLIGATAYRSQMKRVRKGGGTAHF